jgi:hypothetical protein
MNNVVRVLVVAAALVMSVPIAQPGPLHPQLQSAGVSQ